MTLEAKVEQLASQCMAVDAHDKRGLVSLQEHFESIAGETELATLAHIAEVCKRAEEILGDIVLEEGEDLEGLYEQVRGCVSYVQEVANATGRGEDGVNISPPDFINIADDQEVGDSADAILESGEATAESSDDDEDDGKFRVNEEDVDLFNEWIESCRSRFDDLEGLIVSVDGLEEPEAVIANIRREIHTIKGEGGVFGLEMAQRVCHVSESAIDRCLEGGGQFPTDTILAVVDWLKAYLLRPMSELGEVPANTEDILQQVTAVHGSAQSTNVDGCQGVCRDDRVSDEAENSTGNTDDGEEDNALVLMDVDASFGENLSDFVCEAREHLSSAEQALLDLEDQLDDLELINTVFRAFHTIKGVAGFMNLTPVIELAHRAEHLLDRARSGDFKLNSDLVDLLLKSGDLLGNLIGSLEGGPAPRVSTLRLMREQLQRAIEQRPIAPVQCPKVPEKKRCAPMIGELLVEMGIIDDTELQEALEKKEEAWKGLRDILTVAGIDDVETIEMQLLEETAVSRLLREHIVSMGLIDDEALDDAIHLRIESGQRIGKMLGLATEQIAPALRRQREIEIEHTEPVLHARLRRMRANESVDPIGGEAVDNSGLSESSSEGDQSSARAVTAGTGTARAPGLQRQTVKVNMARMDNLVNMVGELVIAQQMVVQDSRIQQLKEQQTQRNLAHVGKIIRDLQEVAMSLRMVTVKGTFQKMARLVRDLAAKSSKSIQFVTDGEETELDRNVVDEIQDPLVHMIRNSCDHGIETKEARRAVGKSETGTLILKAYHQGGSIVIEITDDGQGLDREKILKTAVKRGIIPGDRNPDEIPDQDVFNMIFAPGFSTAEKVTSISGRGVGMDVVRRNLESLHGKIEIQSEKGEGTTFLLRLPLTMAIIDGMIVRVGHHRYVIPTLAIEQSFRPTADQISTVAGRGEAATLHGAILPVYRLKRIFNLESGCDRFDQSLLIVLETNDSRCCLMVDEIIGQQQVVIKSLGQGVRKSQGVSGGAILGDGRVALILDIDGVVNQATELAGDDFAPGRTRSDVKEEPLTALCAA